MKSLLARLLLVVSLALVPALAFQAYTESEARRFRQHLVEDEAMRLVRLVSSEQQRIIEAAEQVLDTLAASPPVQDNVPELCQRLLAGVLHQSPRYNTGGVIGLDGHIRCAPGPFDPAIDLSYRPHFRLALQTGGFVIGEYAVGRMSGRPSIHVAKAFRNQDGEVAGVIDLALDLEWLGQQLDRLPMPPAATAFIADRNGTILARRPDSARYTGTPILPENRFALAGNEIGTATMNSLNDRPMFVAYSPPGADPKGLLIKVGLDRDASFATVTQADRAGLVLIVAGGVAALLVTALAGGRLIRRPLDRLLGTADRWRTGELAARTGLPKDGSEFGRLAAAFDTMAAALEARERNLHTALESTTDSVMMFDRSWRITYLSERAKTHVAQGRDLMGQIVWDALPGTAGSVFANAYRVAMETGLPTHTVGYSDAFQTWFEAHAYPSRDSLTVFFRDVAEERRVAAALRQSDELFGAMFEQAAVGMAQLALDGTWLHVNDRMCSIAGYPREELLARPCQDITHPDDLELTLAQVRALLAGEITRVSLEKRFLRRDGDVIWVNVTASLLHDADGRPERFIAIVEDITTRKRAEASLRESEQRFRKLFDAAPLPGYLIDPRDASIVDCNDSAAAMLGYGRDALRRMRVPDIDPTAKEGTPRAQQTVLTGQSAQFETQHRTRSGEIRDVVIALVPIEIDGRQLGFATVIDITDRKRAEARFRATFEHAAVGIAHIAPDGRFLRVNRRICDGLGYTQEELQGRSVHELVAPEHLPDLLARLRSVASGEIELYTADRCYVAADGRVLELSVTVSMVHDRAEPPYFLVVAQDIGDRKRTEAALHRSEQRLRMMFDVCPLAIGVLADEERHIVQVNPATCAMFGYTAEELMQLSVADLFCDKADLRLPRIGTPGFDETRSGEVQMRTKSGETIWVRYSRTRFDLPGDPRPKVLIIGENVTERRKMEVALRQAQRLEAVGQLTGGMAHDFNNLLNVIVLAAELLVADAGPDAQAAKEILDAALLGADLTRRLLAFARQQPLQAQIVDVNALLVDASHLLRRALGERICVDIQLAPALWPTEVDPSQVQDALLNLAINARDAMPQGGCLTIATANTVLDEAAALAIGVAEDAYIELSVADSGTGMPPEVLQRAVEPFFTTKSPGMGSGLGLASVYGFARQSGGTLVIASTPGLGTTVRLLLPRAEGTASAAPLPTTLPSAHRRGSILLVDDNVALRSVATRQLASLGYQVTAAESGPAALAILRGGARFDLLFTDEVMPEGLSGTQLAEAARAIQPDLKVLFTSGYHQSLATQPGQEPRHLLTKPYRRADLATKVQEALSL